MTNPRHNIRDVFPDTGPEISAKSWLTEAPMRMLMNNLHPDVAENPHELVVYGGIGRAARTWKDFDQILETLKTLQEDETLLVQSGKPVGIIRTHTDAPRVLIANSNLVGRWANWEHFNALEKQGLIVGIQAGRTVVYDGDALLVVRVAARFVQHGFDVRHLRMYLVAAQREAGILEQVLLPLRRRGDGRSGGEARRLLDELADAGAVLHDLLLRRSLGPST